MTEFFDSVPLNNFFSLKNLRNNEIHLISSQIITGLCYLHENNILHQDFNVKNILINPETLSIKIIDFGVSQRITERDIQTIIDRQGNFRFRVPKESLDKSQNCYFSDIWGLCLIVLSLFMKKTLSSKDALKLQLIDENMVESLVLREFLEEKNKNAKIFEFLSVFESRWGNQEIL